MHSDPRSQEHCLYFRRIHTCCVVLNCDGTEIGPDLDMFDAVDPVRARNAIHQYIVKGPQQVKLQLNSSH